MAFDPDKLDELFDKITRLKENHKKQGKLLDDLVASCVHECGKRLNHPKAREHFARAKRAELDALLTAAGLKIDMKTGLVRSRFGAPHSFRDHNAEHLWQLITRAETCFGVHGECDIDPDSDRCRRCRLDRDPRPVMQEAS